jgi:hypothetical protein
MLPLGSPVFVSKRKEPLWTERGKKDGLNWKELSITTSKYPQNFSRFERNARSELCLPQLLSATKRRFWELQTHWKSCGHRSKPLNSQDLVLRGVV